MLRNKDARKVFIGQWPGFITRVIQRTKIVVNKSKKAKHAYQDQDGTRGSDFRGRSRSKSTAENVLDLLPVPVKNKDNGSISPGDKVQARHISITDTDNTSPQSIWKVPGTRKINIHTHAPYFCFCSSPR